MIRERGYDPETLLAEIVEWNAKFDKAGVVFDCDPRKVSQAGQMQSATSPGATLPLQPSANGNGVGRHA